MPPNNTEIVRSVIAAFNSGDIERVLALIDPDFATSVPSALSAEPDTYRGHEGIRRYFASFTDAMDEIRFELDSVEELGGEVVVSIRLTAQGRSTGIAVEQSLAQVWTVRDGKAVEIRSFGSMPEALDAAGAVH